MVIITTLMLTLPFRYSLIKLEFASSKGLPVTMDFGT